MALNVIALKRKYAPVLIPFKLLTLHLALFMSYHVWNSDCMEICDQNLIILKQMKHNRFIQFIFLNLCMLLPCEYRNALRIRRQQDTQSIGSFVISVDSAEQEGIG